MYKDNYGKHADCDTPPWSSKTDEASPPKHPDVGQPTSQTGLYTQLSPQPSPSTSTICSSLPTSPTSAQPQQPSSHLPIRSSKISQVITKFCSISPAAFHVPTSNCDPMSPHSQVAEDQEELSISHCHIHKLHNK